jgi:hypothetical protein
MIPNLASPFQVKRPIASGAIGQRVVATKVLSDHTLQIEGKEQLNTISKTPLYKSTRTFMTSPPFCTNLWSAKLALTSGRFCKIMLRKCAK